MTVDERPRDLPDPEELAAPLVHADMVVAVAGHAGAGKSDLAQAIAERFNDTEIVRFVDAVRSAAESEGRSGTDYAVLQDIGAHWVAQDAAGLVRQVLSSSTLRSRLLLVDGVHHDPVRALLARMIAPTPIWFVMLKAPREAIVARLTAAGETPTEAERVLADSTEVDVDGPLLANADLVLDGSDGIPANADKVIALLNAAPNTTADRSGFVGGLDQAQRESLIRDITDQFAGWLLPAEVSAVTGLSNDEIDRLINQRQLLALDIGGTKLLPTLTLRGGRPNPAVAAVLQAFVGTYSDWESLAWLVSGNGLLDDAYPLATEDPADLQRAIDAELTTD